VYSKDIRYKVQGGTGIASCAMLVESVDGKFGFEFVSL
jgi:hypothetical protein